MLDLQAASSQSQSQGEAERTGSFICFFGSAALEDRVSEARLRVLLTHEAVLAPLRAIAEGREAFMVAYYSAQVLRLGWLYYDTQQRIPEGSREAYAAAQVLVMGALRQLAAQLQVYAAAPEQRQRVARRARRAGFLQVPPAHNNHSGCVPSASQPRLAQDSTGCSTRTQNTYSADTRSCEGKCNSGGRPVARSANNSEVG